MAAILIMLPAPTLMVATGVPVTKATRIQAPNMVLEECAQVRSPDKLEQHWKLDLADLTH